MLPPTGFRLEIWAEPLTSVGVPPVVSIEVYSRVAPSRYIQPQGTTSGIDITRALDIINIVVAFPDALIIS